MSLLSFPVGDGHSLNYKKGWFCNYSRWLQTLQEGQAGQARWSGGAVCKGGAGLCGPSSGRWQSLEPLGKD